MLEDDPLAPCACGHGGQNIFLLAQGENLTADQAGHGHPVKHREDNKETDDICADFLKHRSLDQLLKIGLLQGGGQQNDQQHIRQRVDNIDNAHDDQVNLAAAVTRDRTDRHTDDKDNDAGEKADCKRDAGTVNNTDKVVAPLRVGAEDVGEHLFAGRDISQLGLTVGKRSKIVIRCINRSAELNAEHLVIGIRPEEGKDDAGKRDHHDDDQADQGHLVFHKTLDTVTEEGGGGAHLDQIFLFRCSSGEKCVHIKMQTEWILFHYSVQILSSIEGHYSNVMRGSITL